MPFRNIAVGLPEEAIHPSALKAALAEFLSALIFVFAGEGSILAFCKYAIFFKAQFKADCFVC